MLTICGDEISESPATAHRKPIIARIEKTPPFGSEQATLLVYQDKAHHG
jgi:hypothetical protein